MSNLMSHHVIENVIQYKMRGKVAYLGNLSTTSALQLTYVKLMTIFLQVKDINVLLILKDVMILRCIFQKEIMPYLLRFY